MALLFLAGCAGVPDLGPRPEPRRVDTIAAERSLAGSGSSAWPTDDAWANWGDPQLAGLIEEAFHNAPNLAIAVARLRRAEGVAQEAGASRFPSITAEGQVALDRRSQNIGFPPGFVPGGWNDRTHVATMLAFDPDWWGRNRAALAAAVSRQRAAAVEATEARLLLGAGIASAYSDLAAAFAEQDVQRSALEVRQASRDLLARRFENGMENRGSLRDADADVASARAALEQAEADVALRRHQLAALVGAGPDRGLDIVRPSLAAVSPRALPQDVTTELVGRRPDVVAARKRVEAAAQQLKVSRADFYPAIRLDALAGLQALRLGSLAKPGSLFGSVGPAVSLPIFHGGAIEARYRVSRADFDSAVAEYDRAVVEAYRQVADAVAGGKAAARRLLAAREAFDASEEAYRIAGDRYRAGLSNRLQVLVAEDRVLAARLAVAKAEAAVRGNDIALVRALGGGFPDEGADGARQGVPDA